MMWMLLAFALAAWAWLGEGLGQVEDGGLGVGYLRYPDLVLTLDGCGLGSVGAFVDQISSDSGVLRSAAPDLRECCLMGTVRVAFPSERSVGLPVEQEQVAVQGALARC